MKIEHLHYPRARGKSYRLAEYAAELQDEGYDLVAVVVPTSHHIRHWFEFVMGSPGLDPSRFILFSAKNIRAARGQKFALAGIDDIDMDIAWKDILAELAPNMLNDKVLVTYSYVENI